MSTPSNVWNTDGFPSIASALLFGTTLVPLNQSTATTGYIPQIQTNGGLTLTVPSGLGITWANVLAAGNTSGANNAIMSAGQSLSFADNTVKINSVAALGVNAIAIGTLSSASTSGVAVGASAITSGSGVAIGASSTCPSNAVAIGINANVASTAAQGVAIGNGPIVVEDMDIAIGALSLTAGTTGNGRRIAIGDGATAGAASIPYSIAIGSIASSTGSSSIAIGRASAVSSTQSIAIGISTIPSGSNDICLGPNAITPGTGGSGGRISIGSSSSAGAAAIPFSIAVGANAVAANSSTISIGRLAGSVASALQSVNIGISTSSAGNNDINIGSNASTTNSARSARVNIGVNATTSGDNAVAIGPNTTVTHNGSSVLGRNATSTADNQVTLGNNAVGACNAVLADVGTTGNLQSTGYLITFNQVRGSISAGGAQVIATGAGFTVIGFPTVDYASDYGSPAITSVASQLQTRANRCMIGFLNLTIAFAAGPAVNGFFNVRINKNTNGVVTTVASHSVFVLAAVTDYNISIPFSNFNATTPAPNVFYYCDADNPAGFAQNYTVANSTHFVGQMTN